MEPDVGAMAVKGLSTLYVTGQVLMPHAASAFLDIKKTYPYRSKRLYDCSVHDLAYMQISIKSLYGNHTM